MLAKRDFFMVYYFSLQRNSLKQMLQYDPWHVYSEVNLTLIKGAPFQVCAYPTAAVPSADSF